MKKALLILTIILGTALAACIGNGEETTPTRDKANPARTAPADYQDFENRVRRLETREALISSEGGTNGQGNLPVAVIDESTDLLEMIPSNVALLFALDLAILKARSAELPFDYGRFGSQLENIFERRLNTEEITLENVNRLVFTMAGENGLILLQGNLHAEDIRWQWQEEELDRRSYRGHEVWSGGGAYAFLPGGRTILGSQHEYAVKDFIRMYDGSRTPLAEDRTSAIAQALRKLGMAPIAFAAALHGECQDTLMGCRAYGLAYRGWNEANEELHLAVAIAMPDDEAARETADAEANTSEAITEIVEGLVRWTMSTLDVPLETRIEVDSPRTDGEFVLADVRVVNLRSR